MNLYVGGNDQSLTRKHNKLSNLFANLVSFQKRDEFGQHRSVALYQEVGRVAVSLDAVNN